MPSKYLIWWSSWLQYYILYVARCQYIFTWVFLAMLACRALWMAMWECWHDCHEMFYGCSQSQKRHIRVTLVIFWHFCSCTRRLIFVAHGETFCLLTESLHPRAPPVPTPWPFLEHYLEVNIFAHIHCKYLHSYARTWFKRIHAISFTDASFPVPTISSKFALIQWNRSTSTGWTGTEYCSDIQGSHRMNPNECADVWHFL